MLEALSVWLESMGLWVFVNRYDWVWPVCEMFHFMGMALLIGAIGIIDLRLLGIGKGLPIAKLEALVPIGVIGFVMNAVTGFIFVAGNPIGGPIVYLENLAFQLKMLLILVAGINVLIFYFRGISQAANAVAATDDAPTNAKIVAGVSVFAWIMIIVFGRLIMYNDTLLLFLGL